MDGWFDPHTRIPFVGIIAIVLIVAVVTVFIKTQLQPVFGEPQITVEDERSFIGRASSSFYGTREVSLERKELLTGALNRKTGALIFKADVPNRILSIENAGHTEEILLQHQDGILSSSFEYNAVQSAVTVDAPMRTLSFGTEHSTPVQVSLSDDVVYRGSFVFKGELHAVELQPTAGELLIGTERIPVTKDGKIFYGEWTGKPFTIDMEKQLLSIEEVY